MQRLHAGIHALSWHVFAKEHYVRLQHAGAMRAGRHVETGEIPSVQIGVAVRCVSGVEIRPGRIQAQQFALEISPCKAPFADQATHLIQSTMQIDHVFAAGRLVEPVDVLGQQQRELALPFQPGERMMGRIRLCATESPPADQAARPVALPRCRVTDERLIRHRLRALPAAAGIPVIGDA